MCKDLQLISFFDLFSEQFEDVCLEAALYLLEKMPNEDRHTAVMVSAVVGQLLHVCYLSRACEDTHDQQALLMAIKKHAHHFSHNTSINFAKQKRISNGYPARNHEKHARFLFTLCLCLDALNGVLT